MTVQDIINRVRQIVQETDANNSHATDTTILGWVNDCSLQLASTFSTLPKAKVTNIVAADTITLLNTFLKIDYASISDGTAHGFTELETIDFPNFKRTNTGWENVEDNKPTKLVRMSNLTWMMYPNPDATWTGKALTLIGSVLPAPLTLTTEEPPFSIAVHPCYAHYCSWLFFLLLNNPERAAAEFAAYDALRKMNQQTATSTTGSQLAFKYRGQ